MDLGAERPALHDPATLKWRDPIATRTPLPTPWDKDAFETHARDPAALPDRYPIRMYVMICQTTGAIDAMTARPEATTHTTAMKKWSMRSGRSGSSQRPAR